MSVGHQMRFLRYRQMGWGSFFGKQTNKNPDEFRDDWMRGGEVDWDSAKDEAGLAPWRVSAAGW